jgi:hypothetical protein
MNALKGKVTLTGYTVSKFLGLVYTIDPALHFPLIHLEPKILSKIIPIFGLTTSG